MANRRDLIHEYEGEGAVAHPKVTGGGAVAEGLARLVREALTPINCASQWSIHSASRGRQ